MGKIFFVFFVVLFFIGCNSDDNSRYRRKQCQEPQNPYFEGSGHYAGFNWGMKTGEICDGNSESFNEGCEEYYSELSKYNKCIGNE